MAEWKCCYAGCDFVITDEDKDLLKLSAQSHITQHANPNSSISQPDRTEKAKRPTIIMGFTSEDWTYFLSRWDEYKKLTKMAQNDIVAQLKECCEEDLRKNLFRAHGSLKDNDEEFVLEAIRKQAVHEENVIVARVAHMQMTQDRDEPVQGFVARIKGQANICKYTLKHKCPCNKESDANYSNEMVKNVLACGLADPEIRLSLLSDENQEMSLEQMIKFIEAKEIGKKSASRFSDNHKVNSVKSSYKSEASKKIKNRYQTHEKNSVSSRYKEDPCGWCGRHGHGNYREPGKRWKICPAFGQICMKCNKRNHFAAMCKDTGPVNQSYSSTISSENVDLADYDFQTGAIYQPVINQSQ